MDHTQVGLVQKHSVWRTRRSAARRGDAGTVDPIHFQQLQRFGGLYGVRDEGAIDSALARPRNQWVYQEETDLSTLAATYGYGLTRGHGYANARHSRARGSHLCDLLTQARRMDARVPVFTGMTAGMTVKKDAGIMIGAYRQAD